MNPNSLSLYRRTEFSGRTDLYTSSQQSRVVASNFDEALQGIKPKDVVGSVLTDQYVSDSVSRINSYRYFWRYYSGNHYNVPFDDDSAKPVFNYCKRIVDKRSAWAAGKGFRFIPAHGNEYTSELLFNVWKANGSRSLIRRSAKVALTTGDTFWYFSVKKTDRSGKELPATKQSVRITALNPSYVFPLYAEDDPSEMRAVMIQFPIWDKTTVRMALFSQFITATEVKTYLNEKLTSTAPNVLGIIPLVHIRNDPVGDSIFGHSALKELIPLNIEYNKTMLSVSRVVENHGEPTTIVFGARFSNLERGAHKVWSNLPSPKEADIRNLEMKEPMIAKDYLAILERQIHAQGKAPRSAFDSEGLSISNTSGTAMHLLFQPLIEATNELQDSFEEGIMLGNQIIAAIHASIFQEPLENLVDSEKTSDFLNLDVDWISIMPKDEQMELDRVLKLVGAKVLSRREAASLVTRYQDSERMALELAADDMFELANAREKGVALQGGVPKLNSVFLSSLFIDEDLLDVAKKLGDIDPGNEIPEMDGSSSAKE